MELSNIRYKRDSYLLGKKITFTIEDVGNVRNYPDFIKNYDNVFVITITEEHKCPNCGIISLYKNKFPYSFDDIFELWKIAYNVIVLQKEKIKYIDKLENLLKELKNDIKNLSNWL